MWLWNIHQPTKTSDTVKQIILISKLEYLALENMPSPGFGPTLQKGINMFQSISSLKIIYDVLQGSVLGPSLFIFFVKRTINTLIMILNK